MFAAFNLGNHPQDSSARSILYAWTSAHEPSNMAWWVGRSFQAVNHDVEK
jgi:hypothetical protein